MKFEIQRFSDSSFEQLIQDADTKVSVKMTKPGGEGVVSRTFSGVVNVTPILFSATAATTGQTEQYLKLCTTALAYMTKNTPTSMTYSISAQINLSE